MNARVGIASHQGINLHQHRSGPACPSRTMWRSSQCRQQAGIARVPSALPTEQKEQKQQEGTEMGEQPRQEDPLARAGAWAAELVASPIFYLIAGLLAVKLVSSTGEQSSTILAFAALPVVALTILSKSSLGKEVQAQLEAKLPQLLAEAQLLRAAQEAARARSSGYGEARPRVWGLGTAPHLTGHLPGDAGFDPLNLASDPAALARNREAELLHARWAMLGAIGCLVPEVLSMNGVALPEPVWWKVGATVLQGDLTLNWGGIEGFRIAGKQGIWVIAGCQVVLMGGPEYARQVGIKSLEPVGVFLEGDQNYPGGAPFDPLKLSHNPDFFVESANQELSVGRWAMIAMLGYAAQAAITREGPVRNLVDFAADPLHNNLFGRVLQ